MHRYEVGAFVGMVQQGKTEDTTLTWDLVRTVFPRGADAACAARRFGLRHRTSTSTGGMWCGRVYWCTSERAPVHVTAHGPLHALPPPPPSHRTHTPLPPCHPPAGTRRREGARCCTGRRGHCLPGRCNEVTRAPPGPAHAAASTTSRRCVRRHHQHGQKAEGPCGKTRAKV